MSKGLMRGHTAEGVIEHLRDHRVIDSQVAKILRFWQACDSGITNDIRDCETQLYREQVLNPPIN